MFRIDQLVADCIDAMYETEFRRATQEVLERAVRRPADLSAALPADRASVVPLHASDRLSVLHVVWAPGMRLRPHNHLMWAAIAIYGGQEDNTFYRRHGSGLARSGGRVLREGDVTILGDGIIHAVHNPCRTFTAAIHVYGGNIVDRLGRSEWDDDAGELPYDFERTRAYFDTANAHRAGVRRRSQDPRR